MRPPPEHRPEGPTVNAGLPLPGPEDLYRPESFDRLLGGLLQEKRGQEVEPLIRALAYQANQWRGLAALAAAVLREARPPEGEDEAAAWETRRRDVLERQQRTIPDPPRFMGDPYHGKPPTAPPVADPGGGDDAE